MTNGALLEELELREAVLADAPAIALVLREAFAEYRGQLDPPSSSVDVTVHGVCQKMATAWATLAMHGTKVVGCVFFEPEDNYLYFFSLAVLPAYRERGIGRMLIEFVENRARTINLMGVRLSVRLALSRLHAYYNHLGYCFREYRSHEGYREPTYAILEKDFRNLDALRET